MTPRTYINPSSQGVNKGFALISTISIMSLLLIIALSMMSLSTVTTREITRNSAQAEAQANARYALMLAIGKLQTHLGPDQRISMTADQRSDASGDGSVTSAALGNRHWTGVYDAWTPDSETRPDPKFRSWLISGDPSSTNQLDLSDSVLPSAQSMELVGAGTVGADIKDYVSVPLVGISDGVNNRGRIAYWIGDQGVKAAIGTPPPTEGTSLGLTRNNLHTAPRNAVELASVMDVKPFADLDSDDPKLAKVTSWQQTAHLLTDIRAPRPLFHDLSAFSTGLLTNVRDGGFRKDLSMKMETYTGAPDLTNLEEVLYTAKSTMSGNEEVGINFMELWGYYHLYKELKYGGGLNYTTGGSIPVDVAYLETKKTQAELNSDTWDRLKHPITINYQTVFSFEADPHASEDGKYVLWLNFDPVVTLWNPLDVPVNVPRHAEGRQWNYLYSFWMIPYDINVSINGGPEIKCSILKSANRKNDGNFLKLNAGVEEALTLKPGEVVKISQDGDLSSDQRGQSIGGWEGFNGKKGFNYGGGARVPLLTENSSLGSGDIADLEHVVVSATDTISYTVTPRATAESGNSSKFARTHVWLNLGGRGGSLHSFMSVDSRIGYSRAQVGEKRRYGGYWGPNPLDIRANEHPEVFPVLEGPSETRDLPVSGLINEKAPFMVHSYFAKTEEENLSSTRMMARFNPRAYSHNFYDLSKRERDMMPFETTVIGMTSWLDAPLDESITGQGYFGSSLGAQFGASFVNTHSVPRQPIVSLAALQHSFANGFNMPTRDTPCETDRKPDHTNQLYPLEPQISHAIGNSLAPSVIPSDKTTHNIAGYPDPLADHSYLANRELWDDYFFSGIAPESSRAFGAERDQKTVALEFFNYTKPLPVTRYLPRSGGPEAEKLVNSFFDGIKPNDLAVRSVASHLRVDGMFNVNSTSVEAWKTVLGSLKDRPIVVSSVDGSESIAPKDGKTPVAGINAPRNVIIEDENVPSAEQWTGRRVLTDDEIEELAIAIVKQVRKRGPFLSLSDFVNRRVGTDKKLARSGAIQSALDSDEVEINKEQNTGRGVDPSVASSVASRFEFPEAEEGAMNYGAPSYVKQGDILTPIAPILSARSDSFIIRAYGESLDNKGNVLAQAWCEAVVERNRDYIDTTDNPEILPLDLIITVNKDYGRRFNMILFRWLNANEI